MKKREKYDHAILERKIKREELEERLRHIFFPFEKREFFVVLRFKPEENEFYKRAVEKAKEFPSYREYGQGKWKKHEVRFSRGEVRELKEFFEIAQNLKELEVLVEGKRIPYGRDLWLPLLWFYLFN